MAGAQTVWGIDVGRCALKAIKLRAVGDGTVEVLAHDYIEHAKILTQPDADRNELISAALEKFLSRNDISRDQIVVSVPGQHTLARFTKLPPVAPKRVPDIIRYEADQQIPFDMDEVIWDYQTFTQEDLPDIEVGIFAMKRELIREHLLHFEQAAIEPMIVQSGPLAVYNAMHFEGLLEGDTTMVMDIGAECTDLIIGTAHGLWTRSIPIGGNKFTEALVRSFKLSFSKSENLKRSVPTKFKRQIFQAMRPILSDLVQELQRSQGFYASTHRDANIVNVYVLGNASRMEGLRKYLQQNLGLAVKRPEGIKKVGGDGVAKASKLAENLPAFFCAYGLALQGLDLVPVMSNLLPVELAKQVVWRKKRPSFAAAAACLLVAGGLVWFRQSADLSALAAGGDVATPALDASEALANGCSPGLPPKMCAKQILDAGNKLKSDYRKLEGGGGAQREEAESLVALQQHKTLVPRVLRVIHESVPVPSAALGAATTQADVRTAIADLVASNDSIAQRENREQLFIKSLDMQYQWNLNEYDWVSLFDVPDPINDPDAEVRGIFVEIKCTSPHKDGAKFVEERFLSVLREKGRVAGQGFYIDRAIIVEASRVETRSGKSSGPRSSSGRVPISRGIAPGVMGGGGGIGGGPAGAPIIRQADMNPDALDPITDEPIENDWSFEIWIDVILEDYEEPETGDDGTAEEDGGG